MDLVFFTQALPTHRLLIQIKWLLMLLIGGLVTVRGFAVIMYSSAVEKEHCAVPCLYCLR